MLRSTMFVLTVKQRCIVINSCYIIVLLDVSGLQGAQMYNSSAISCNNIVSINQSVIYVNIPLLIFIYPDTCNYSMKPNYSKLSERAHTMPTKHTGKEQIHTISNFSCRTNPTSKSAHLLSSSSLDLGLFPSMRGVGLHGGLLGLGGALALALLLLGGVLLGGRARLAAAGGARDGSGGGQLVDGGDGDARQQLGQHVHEVLADGPAGALVVPHLDGFVVLAVLVELIVRLDGWVTQNRDGARV